MPVRLSVLRDVLEPWCAAGVSGVLRVLDAPGGAVYLVDGGLAYAECPVASGIDRLLTISGRLPIEAWRTALAAGRTRHRVGEELVHSGLLTLAELETVIQVALLDAAHFLLDAVAEVRFEPGLRHPIGPTRTLELGAVCREVDRRKRMLVDAWPDAAIDTAAVLPARRLTDQFVALTALQWEVVANADRRRSPIDLARLLGRDTFTVMLEVRRMARAGLVEPGRPGGSVAAESVATVRARAAAPVPPVAPRMRRPPDESTVDDRPATPEEPLPHRVAATEEEAADRFDATGNGNSNGNGSAPIGAGTFETCYSEDILLRILAGLAAL